MRPQDIVKGKKYIRGGLIIQADYICSIGTFFKVIEGISCHNRTARDFLIHNNDKDFWNNLEVYVPPPEKKKIFIIIWKPKAGALIPSMDWNSEDAYNLYYAGYIPLKGFEIEVEIPQVQG